MSEFNAGKRDRRRAETLQAEHRRTALLDGAMILLDHIVQIAARPNFHALPSTVLSAQQPQATVSRAVAIDVAHR